MGRRRGADNSTWPTASSNVGFVTLLPCCPAAQLPCRSAAVDTALLPAALLQVAVGENLLPNPGRRSSPSPNHRWPRRQPARSDADVVPESPLPGLNHRRGQPVRSSASVVPESHLTGGTILVARQRGLAQMLYRSAICPAGPSPLRASGVGCTC